MRRAARYAMLLMASAGGVLKRRGLVALAWRAKAWLGGAHTYVRRCVAEAAAVYAEWGRWEAVSCRSSSACQCSALAREIARENREVPTATGVSRVVGGGESWRGCGAGGWR